MILPGEMKSYWVATTSPMEFGALSGKAEADVAIIGGGWVGILTADLLKRAGRKVVLIESRRVAEQVTGHTTAKLTSLHGLVYAELVEKFGEDAARLYGEANQQAIEYVVKTALERGIDCDLERKAAYTFTQSAESLLRISKEAEVAQRLGLPANFLTELSLPFPTAGAVRFDNQAQFHPLKFIRALAAGIPGDGSHVFEETRALDIDHGVPHRVITDRGTVSARDVVVATNLPFLMQGSYFAKVFPYRHEVLMSRLPAEKEIDGMFLRVDDPTYSFRTQRDPGGTLLITVGPAFRTGQGNTEKQVNDLEAYTRSHFGVEQIAYRWGNQDYYSPDRVPFVGKLGHSSRRVYVATGFSAWGLTNGVVAATILADHICERRNPYADLYDSTRLHLRATGKEILRENLEVARGWIGDRVRGWRLKAVCDVSRGEGAVCKRDGEVLAVYKSESGEIHYLSPKCTHLGCHVSWNSAERSWDCPCHGSRFSPEGKVLEGPAVRDLERKPMD
jgi:glycine/D-amino acid oxidase-like deaminating enzyme/nitrite reductase/ring-hydroxylating ferredoxin subunit